MSYNSLSRIPASSGFSACSDLTYEVAGTALVDVHRRDSGRITVSCNKFGFKPLVIGCHVVGDTGSSHEYLNCGTHFQRAARLLAQTNPQAGESGQTGD